MENENKLYIGTGGEKQFMELSRANRHGLLTLYRVFTRNHRYGNAAYDWKGRSITIKGKAVVLQWPVSCGDLDVHLMRLLPLRSASGGMSSASKGTLSGARSRKWARCCSRGCSN